ncbi:MAG: hypothetical protein K8F25_01225 [Fimbriimonadaceae bacterium]|nr:hypothetical protein [Alphaproteobacteria bacterium]
MQKTNTIAVRNFALGALVVVVVVLGYFLYLEQQRTDTIELKLDLPDVEIQNN